MRDVVTVTIVRAIPHRRPIGIRSKSSIILTEVTKILTGVDITICMVIYALDPILLRNSSTTTTDRIYTDWDQIQIVW